MITESQYVKCADLLNVEPAVIKAVAEVESNGEGFLKDGKPKILFEPHIFWKQLRMRNIRPESHTNGNNDILYPIWQPGKYGPVSMFAWVFQSFATPILEKGIDIRYIKDILGHFNLKTTERYLHVKREQLINIVSPPDDIWKKGSIEW